MHRSGGDAALRVSRVAFNGPEHHRKIQDEIFLFICLRFMPGPETVAHILSLNERAALSMEPGRLIQTQWPSARWCFGWIQVPTVD